MPELRAKKDSFRGDRPTVNNISRNIRPFFTSNEKLRIDMGGEFFHFLTPFFLSKRAIYTLAIIFNYRDKIVLRIDTKRFKAKFLRNTIKTFLLRVKNTKTIVFNSVSKAL